MTDEQLLQPANDVIDGEKKLEMLWIICSIFNSFHFLNYLLKLNIEFL